MILVQLILPDGKELGVMRFDQIPPPGTLIEFGDDGDAAWYKVLVLRIYRLGYTLEVMKVATPLGAK